jgi:molecular chaperone DnaK
MPENNPVLGFDLGTTFSALSQWKDGRGSAIIRNHVGEETTQSVVFYNPENEDILVGTLAYNQGLAKPENMIVGVKRNMDDGEKELVIGGKTFSAIELSAQILKSMYEDAKNQFPTGLFSSRGSVVTVPFYFKANQIEATKKAAEIADINCIRIIQEPIAASLQYAYELCQDRGGEEFSENILVFDLGGGTFDLTLFKLINTKDKLLFEVIGTGGDDRLGGMDFDKCLAEKILKNAGLSLQGLDEKQKNEASAKLLKNTIETKIALGATTTFFAAVPYLVPPDIHLQTNITREEFENCIKEYLTKIEGIMDSLWARSGFNPSDIDRVIQVGGSSAIPCVKALLQEAIGEDRIWANTNPHTSIAKGAAMYAAFVDDPEFFEKEIEITTRTCHALGVEASEHRFVSIIQANTPTPCKRKHLFTTTENNATSIEINIFQGSGKIIDKERRTHDLIGTLNIDDLPLKPAGDLEIEVTFQLGQDQELSASVKVEDKISSAKLKFT